MIDLDALERMAVELPAGAIGYVPIGPKLFAALIAELRAARKVVEAARAYVDRIEAEALTVEPWNAPELDDGIRAALAELEALK